MSMLSKYELIIINYSFILIDKELFPVTNTSTMNISLSGIYNIQGCSNYNLLLSPEVRTKFVPFFKSIEEDYKCSGACKKANKYIFSNVNK